MSKKMKDLTEAEYLELPVTKELADSVFDDIAEKLDETMEELDSLCRFAMRTRCNHERPQPEVDEFLQSVTGSFAMLGKLRRAAVALAEKTKRAGSELAP